MSEVADTVPVNVKLDLRQPGSPLLVQTIIGGGNGAVLLRPSADPDNPGQLVLEVLAPGTGDTELDLLNLAELLEVTAAAITKMSDLEAAATPGGVPSSGAGPDEMFST